MSLRRNQSLIHRLFIRWKLILEKQDRPQKLKAFNNSAWVEVLDKWRSSGETYVNDPTWLECLSTCVSGHSLKKSNTPLSPKAPHSISIISYNIINEQSFTCSQQSVSPVNGLFIGNKTGTWNLGYLPTPVSIGPNIKFLLAYFSHW